MAKSTKIYKKGEELKAVLTGIIPVMVTPMLSNREIDPIGIKNVINFYKKNNIKGLWGLGSTGEELSLTKKQIVDFINEISKYNDQIYTILGTGANSAIDMLDIVEKLQNLPCAFHYISRDTKISENLTIKNLIHLADNLPRPLWLYNNVKRGKEITENIIREVKDHPNIHGIKYGAFYHMPLIKAAKYNSSDFQVLTAGNFLLTHLLYGGIASTSSDANMWPGLYDKIFYYFSNNNILKAREILYKCIEFSSKFPRTENGENVAEAKYFLSLDNICEEFCNYNFEELTKDQKNQIKKIKNEIEEYSNNICM